MFGKFGSGRSEAAFESLKMSRGERIRKLVELRQALLAEQRQEQRHQAVHEASSPEHIGSGPSELHRALPI